MNTTIAAVIFGVVFILGIVLACCSKPKIPVKEISDDEGLGLWAFIFFVFCGIVIFFAIRHYFY